MSLGGTAYIPHTHTHISIPLLPPPPNRLGKLADSPSPAHHDEGGLNPRRAIVRDPRFARLLGHMASLTTTTTANSHHNKEVEAEPWGPKACTLILNGLSHLVVPLEATTTSSLLPLLRRVAGFAADSLLRQEAAALAPRHVSLPLNALARLLPVLEAEAEGEEEGGGAAAVARRAEWGLFVSAMVARYVCSPPPPTPNPDAMKEGRPNTIPHLTQTTHPSTHLAFHIRAHPLLPAFPPREFATLANALSRLLAPTLLPLLGGGAGLTSQAAMGLSPWHLTPAFLGALEARAEARLPLCQVRFLV